jgi:hypothetical protein
MFKLSDRLPKPRLLLRHKEKLCVFKNRLKSRNDRNLLLSSKSRTRRSDKRLLSKMLRKSKLIRPKNKPRKS